MTLEEALREAARSGLQAMTLWKLDGGRWQGNVSHDRKAWRVEIVDDPVEALKQALGVPAVSAMTNGNDGSGDVFG